MESFSGIGHQMFRTWCVMLCISSGPVWGCGACCCWRTRCFSASALWAFFCFCFIFWSPHTFFFFMLIARWVYFFLLFFRLNFSDGTKFYSPQSFDRPWMEYVLNRDEIWSQTSRDPHKNSEISLFQSSVKRFCILQSDKLHDSMQAGLCGMRDVWWDEFALLAGPHACFFKYNPDSLLTRWLIFIPVLLHVFPLDWSWYIALNLIARHALTAAM